MNSPLATTPGTLYLVATPIGNRDDITTRARHVLETVDVILAEDTRHSLPLLRMLGIKTPLQSLHAHNENTQSERLIEALLTGQNFALISDAGTPLICDPGFPLVRLARQRHVPVVPVPGACALIAALSASGLAAEPFTFAGFLPPKKSARRKTLDTFKSLTHTLVWYESTHRLVESLEDIADVFGADTPIVLAKELTKTFETFFSGTPKEVLAWLAEDPQRVRGEFVLMIGARDTENACVSHLEFLLSTLLEELPLKQAVNIASTLSGQAKNEVYALALRLKSL